MMTYKEIRKNEDIRTYIAEADASLAALGFTEHSFAHVTHVAEIAGYMLETLGLGQPRRWGCSKGLGCYLNRRFESLCFLPTCACCYSPSHSIITPIVLWGHAITLFKNAVKMCVI